MGRILVMCPPLFIYWKSGNFKIKELWNRKTLVKHTWVAAGTGIYHHVNRLLQSFKLVFDQYLCNSFITIAMNSCTDVKQQPQQSLAICTLLKQTIYRCITTTEVSSCVSTSETNKTHIYMISLDKDWLLVLNFVYFKINEL